MKIAGTHKYPYYAGSPTDKLALGFDTEPQAVAHADRMNKRLENYPDGWRAKYWKTKPDQWITGEVL